MFCAAGRRTLFSTHYCTRDNKIYMYIHIDYYYIYVIVNTQQLYIYTFKRKKETADLLDEILSDDSDWDSLLERSSLVQKKKKRKMLKFWN